MRRRAWRPTGRLARASVVFAVAVLAAVLVQRSLLARVPPAPPDLVALVVCCGGIARGPRVGAVWGLVAGLLCDLAPPAAAPAGPWAFALAATGLAAGLAAAARSPAVGRSASRVFPGSAPDGGGLAAGSRTRHAGLVGLAALLAGILHLLGDALIGADLAVLDASTVLLAVAAAALYAAVLAWLCARPLVAALAPPPGSR